MARAPGSALCAALLALLAVGLDAAAQTSLIFSEYVEGSSNNKALEIYNGTGSPVNMGLYRLDLYYSGALTPTSLALDAVSLANGEVFVFSAASASTAILAQADQTTTVALWKGDDAIVLRRVSDGAVIDAIGQVGFDPGAEWGTGLASTADNTLRRKTVTCEGDTNPSDAYDPAGGWDGYAIDTFGGLGAHLSACQPIPTQDESWSGLKGTYR